MRGACVRVERQYKRATTRNVCAVESNQLYDDFSSCNHGRPSTMEAARHRRRRGYRRTAVARRCVTDLAVPCQLPHLLP